MDLEGSIICEGDTPQSSWSPEAHQDEGRNSNHRQSLAFYEGSDFPQPALRSRQSAGEGEGPECPVPVLEADGGPLGGDWEALFVGHAQASMTHFWRQASRGAYSTDPGRGHFTKKACHCFQAEILFFHRTGSNTRNFQTISLCKLQSSKSMHLLQTPIVQINASATALAQ